MGLANFFDKINLSAAQRIRNHDREEFETNLLNNCIGIIYTVEIIEKPEGRTILDLLVRLLARLYPNIRFVELGNNGSDSEYTRFLKELCTNINKEITLDNHQDITFSIVIGDIADFDIQAPVVYIGSDNWTCTFSQLKPQKCGSTNNPFGAGAAACFASSFVFRYVFAKELGSVLNDSDFTFSSFTQEINADASLDPVWDDNVHCQFTLVGGGAIGNGVLWAFRQMKLLKGTICLVEHQSIDISNLQRYVLALQQDIDEPKGEVLKQLFADFKQLDFNVYPDKWQTVACNLSKDEMELVITAVDSKQVRMYVQSSLPRNILNGWTSPDGIGISRHLNFLKDVCLCCLYLPRTEEKSHTQKIADALRIPNEESFIHDYVSNGIPIDEVFNKKVSELTGISIEKLDNYKGKNVEILYSEGLCGGRLFDVTSDVSAQDMEVPLAHESALAGVLLAAEVVIHSLNYRRNKIESLTKINTTQPLHNFMKEAEGKHYTGACICQDNVYIQAYKEKYSC